jgi:5-formyltetrahydrofolate cyclo-ligase
MAPTVDEEESGLAAAKAELRERMAEVRRVAVGMLSPDQRAFAAQSLAEWLEDRWERGAVVASYRAVGLELDPSRATPGAALPWFADRDAPMRFRRGPPVERGPWGIPQPADDAPEVIPSVVLVPALAVTPTGERLGRGGGHYDRWVASLPRRRSVTLVGVAWWAQVIGRIPAEPHDLRLDHVVTPNRWIDCAAERARAGA